MNLDFDIATSRYQNQDAIIASGLVPVGITVGRPRFRLRYTFVHDKTLLAPDYWMLKKPEDERITHFEEWYRDKLDKRALEIAATLTGISQTHGNRGVVLLCFENVHKGERCHRTMLAKWLQEQTGRSVAELEDSRSAEPIPTIPGMEQA